MANLGQNYSDAGRLDEAIALLEETLRLCQGKLGPEHATTLLSMRNLAGAYEAAGRLNDELPLCEEHFGLSKKRWDRSTLRHSGP